MRGLQSIVAFALLLAGMPASAETLAVRYLVPAEDDALGAAETIAVEALDGDPGDAVRDALIARLRGYRLNGAPAVRIASTPEANAAIAGDVLVSLDEREDGTRSDSRCVERDTRGKCVRKEKFQIPCRRLVVELEPRLSVIARSHGEVRRISAREDRSERFCRGDSEPGWTGLADDAAKAVAGRLVEGLVLHQVDGNVRVMESRKGLDKASAAAFRDAVRLTRHDPIGACMAFSTLAEQVPSHASSAFNTGLCREHEGRYSEARAMYLIAGGLPDGGSRSREAIERLDRHARALEQLAMRGKTPKG